MRQDRPSRGWIKGTFAALIVTILLATGGARRSDVPQEIAVGGVYVQEAEGKTRMALLTSPVSGTTMSLMNSRGRPEVNIAVKPNGDKHLFVSDSKSRRTIGIDLFPDGTASIGIDGFGLSAGPAPTKPLLQQGL